MLGGFISKTDYLNLFFLYLNVLSEFFNFRKSISIFIFNLNDVRGRF
ncbi:hypothetical protein LEP1GSC127_1781 [Leptospira kirschneri str. 200801925]|uniref:Uncharacterized protein n=1 Tax=Leptospira kirschneri str. 200802841 TaxID=1193047 RepID=A0A828Y3D7_9LEPT|nr:hypothetical protein LEP1GSC044_3634 [Leptospira kirschneri serovar Grippotyphosa str. RM52]EKO52241.1 hypothetical protein LEP1GSC131_3535 [Leptospira kirschneri str. 200802841]EKP06255.1 hypothetical protein LEP1GSC018_1681 [Leptospira kirschneri str. 2008720114]EKQ85086.1 hypothetical protein LEP1GSC064_1515 [Leptospira kirschneri serovar Grippotyphosa str. Moskva]EKR06840.1 hypothetical protein LEP1GSC122_1066 [Leptospira kirschneri serovar Valbuzzi str. 200702274]EMK03191.1 hypothetica